MQSRPRQRPRRWACRSHLRRSAGRRNAVFMSSNSPPGAAGLPTRGAAPARRFARLRWTARAVLWLLVAAWAALFVGWLSLHWLILPHIEEWRPAIEARASRMLGAPVRIGAIEARSSGWVPAIELRDVRILDAEQRVALTLPRVFAALSPRSLLALEPRFEQLLIDGPSLDVRRDESGRIRVAGLDFGAAPAAEDDDGAADWFFRQHEFVIRGGTLRWIDERRDAPPLALADVELVVRNGLREHDVRLDATPPAGWGERFSLRGRFTQPLFAKSGDWRLWSGTAYADLPRADVSELRRRVTLPFELSEGDGALRALVRGARRPADQRLGRPRAARGRAAPRQERRAARVRADRRPDRRRADRRSHQRRRARLRLSHRRRPELAEGRPARRLARKRKRRRHQRRVRRRAARRRRDGRDRHARADRRRGARAARRRPSARHDQRAAHALGRAARRAGALPRQGPAQRPRRCAPGRRPRPTRSAGPASATPRCSSMPTRAAARRRSTCAPAHIDLPGVFDERELPLDRLDAKLSWKIERAAGGAAPKITVRVASASFANADAKGELSGTWRSGSGSGFGRAGRYPGELELDGKLVDGVAARTARYLPLGLPEGVRSYVARAVRAGTITSATVRVRGDLWDFPFHDPKVARDGDFRIAGKFDGLTFAYVPGEPASAPTAGAAAAAARDVWPPFTGGSGELVVDRSTLEIRAAKAHLGNVEWSALQGRIPELGSNARLDIEGTARGPLAEMLRFVDTTPVGRWTGRALAAATATGPAELKLALAMPLGAPGRDRRQRQPGARRQRRPHDARHAAARRRQGARRLHPEGLRRQRRERAHARRRDRLRRRLERRLERRRQPALQRSRHGQRRGLAPGARARLARAAGRLADRPDRLSRHARVRRRAAADQRREQPGRPRRRPAGAVRQGGSDAARAARPHRPRRRRRAAGGRRHGAAARVAAGRPRRHAAGAVRSRDERRRRARRARRDPRRRGRAAIASSSLRRATCSTCPRFRQRRRRQRRDEAPRRRRLAGRARAPAGRAGAAGGGQRRGAAGLRRQRRRRLRSRHDRACASASSRSARAASTT